MRRLTRLLFLSAFLFAAHATAQSTEGLDLNGIPRPIAPSPFYALRGFGVQDVHFIDLGARLSGVQKPLVASVPSPAPEGYPSAIVSGALLTELAFAAGLGAGFDAGLALGVHLYQWGPGVGPLTGGQTGVERFGAIDPKVEVGFTTSGGKIKLRPFAALTLPWGTAQAFAGENKVRFEGGTTIGGSSDLVIWGAEVAFLYRSPLEFSATTWGSQLRFGAALHFRLTEKIALGPELSINPVLQSQQGGTGSLIPAEILATYAMDLQRLTLKAALGTGLPLSHRTQNGQGEWFRGPTSPLVRLGVDVAARF